MIKNNDTANHTRSKKSISFVQVVSPASLLSDGILFLNLAMYSLPDSRIILERYHRNIMYFYQIAEKSGVSLFVSKIADSKR